MAVGEALAGQDAAPDPRRCRLTLLFCDLCGSTALSDALEAEDYAELLRSLRAAGETAVTRHGGIVVRTQGDGMLAMFGYPQPREGDGRRAVEAALHLHHAAVAMSFQGFRIDGGPLRLHSGIHSGMVLVQPGDVMLGRYELLGAAPNIAARLQAAARPGEILVSEGTLGPDRYFFDVAEQRTVAVDLRNAAVACWPVRNRNRRSTPYEARARGGLQPFTGREAEIRRLEDGLGRALWGASVQIAISGPPGVGKTRLAEEFLVQAVWKGCRVLRGRCDEELDARPLQPLLLMLHDWLALGTEAPAPALRAALERELAALQLPALAAPLLQALGLSSERGADGGANCDAAGTTAAVALATLFAALAARQPLVLFVDDWHWSDSAARQALASFGAAAAGAPLLVVCSVRGIDPGDASMDSVEVVELAPFSAAEASRSVQALLPHADPFVAAEICRYAGGNALFIEELCHSAAHEGPLHRNLGAAWLKTLVDSRVARLPAEQAELVRTAAIIGNVVPIGLLAELSGQRTDDAALQALAERDFLFPDAPGTLRFKHGLTRDVVYESVGLHQRRALHLQVAGALQRRAEGARDTPHEALAYHLGAAGHAAAAALHAEQAGDRAAAISALDRAKTLYHAALARLDEAGGPPPAAAQWLAIANKLGLICVFDAARRDLPVFERAVQIAAASGDAQSLARAEYWLGYILYALGESRAAIVHCERALAAAGRGGDALAVQIRATLGQVRTAASDYAEALPLLEEAAAIKRSHRRGSRPPVGLAYTLVCLGSVVGDQGDFERAHDCFDEAWALLRGATHEIGASIQGWRSAVLTWQGRWAEARDAAQQSARIAEQTRSLFQFCQGRATAGYAGWKLAADPKAIAMADDATAWLEPRDSGLFRSLNHGWLVDGWFALGEREKARRHAALALRRARTGDLIGVAMTCRGLALDAARRGAAGQAQHRLEQAVRTAERRQSRHEAASNRLCGAEVARLLGRDAEAASAARAARDAFETLAMHWHVAQARRLL